MWVGEAGDGLGCSRGRHVDFLPLHPDSMFLKHMEPLIELTEVLTEMWVNLSAVRTAYEDICAFRIEAPRAVDLPDIAILLLASSRQSERIQFKTRCRCFSVPSQPHITVRRRTNIS